MRIKYRNPKTGRYEEKNMNKFKHIDQHYVKKAFFYRFVETIKRIFGILYNVLLISAILIITAIKTFNHERILRRRKQ